MCIECLNQKRFDTSPYELYIKWGFDGLKSGAKKYPYPLLYGSPFVELHGSCALSAISTTTISSN